MRGFSILLAIGLTFAAGAATAAIFIPDDQLMSDPTFNLKDPEFDSVGNRMVWQDDDGNLWVADVDPVSGDVIPLDGKGQLLETGLSNLVLTGNGPEWGYGAGETFIAYTKTVNNKRFIGVARQGTGAGGNWVSGLLGASGDRWRPMATVPGTPDTGRIIYVRKLEDGEKVVAWRVIDDPDSEQIYTNVGDNGGRWSDGERAFVAPNQVDGVNQIFWVDIDTQEVTQITDDPDEKFNMFLWYAPEFDDVLISAGINSTHVGIFRRIEGVWTRIMMIAVPSQFEFISSPEPFVYNGRSYISVVAAESLGVGPLLYFPSGPAELWITGIDPDNPFYRRIDSGEDGIRRAEPEPFAVASGQYVFYTQTDPNTNNATLRRAATGLGSPGAPDTDGDGFVDDGDNCTEVANPAQRDTDGDGIGNYCDADLDNDCSVNFSDLATVKERFFTDDADADFDGDGTVSFSDLSILKLYIFQAPGPANPPTLCAPL